MPDNAKLVSNLFAALEANLFLGDRLKDGEFVTLMQPGQFVSPNIVESDSTDDMAIQAELANQVLDTSFVYKPLLGSVDSIYNDALYQSALPHAALPDSAVTEITAIKKWIVANQDAYNTYESRYFDAQDAYATEQNAQHPSGSRLRRLSQAVNDARSNWISLGQKNQWDLKQARLAYLTAPDPETVWDGFRNTFAQSQKRAPNKGAYTETFLSPPISAWAAPDTSWSTFDKHVTESDSTYHSHSTAWSGGISIGFGLFSLGGSASGSSHQESRTSDVSDVRLKFDYLRVRIVRPWLVENVFAYHFWTWRQAFGCDALSDGGNLALEPPVRPIGRMPLLPKALVVVRNVELTANFSHNDQSIVDSQLSAGASIGFGPFSIGGSYSEATADQTVKGTFDGSVAKIPFPQIIAVGGTLLPRCPSPIASLPWQGDQCKDGLSIAGLREQRLRDYLSYTALDYAATAEAERQGRHDALLADARRNAFIAAEKHGRELVAKHSELSD